MAYCSRCERYFGSQRALQQHKENSSAHYLCNDCNRDFPSWTALKEHYVQSRLHSYCQYCDEHFDDDEELEDHYRNEHYYCEDCEKVFQTERGLHEHYRQSHYYCTMCKRIFISQNNLNAHLNSSVHRPKDVYCPFRGCGQAFVSRSALILHLESGYCASGATRDKINQAIRQLDTKHVITDPSRLLTNGEGRDNIRYWATEDTYNDCADAYECYLCHGLFRTLRALNAHLDSPRHQNKIYICPMNTCRTRFSTLSALWQHVKSEKCGVSKFQNVQRAMNKIVTGVGRITF